MTDEYFELDLPVAPAIMVGNEIVVEGSDVEEDKLEAAICRHLGLPEPASSKKRMVDRFLKRQPLESCIKILKVIIARFVITYQKIFYYEPTKP